MAESRNYTMGGTVGLGALLLAGAAVMVALVTFFFGYVTGSEFNPNTFERRRFGFYEIPLIRLQVTPLFRKEANGEVDGLVSSTYVKPRAGAKEEWHLIAFSRSSRTPTTTDVQILARYLDAYDSSAGRYWHEWSIKHPGHAAVLWPEVARLARLDLYVLMPPLFELARSAGDDPKELQAALSQLQARQIVETADRLEKRIATAKTPEAKAALEKRVQELRAALAVEAPVAETPTEGKKAG